MKTFLYVVLLLACSMAQAAKITVSWTNPSTNTDNTPLTDLSYVIVEWGTCNGTAFDVMKGSALIVTTEVGKTMKTFIYPTGLTKVCVRAQVFNMKGIASAYSNVAFKDLLPTPGKPVTLGKPVILNFKEN